MSVITDTWRFLKERRLWPVAILLIVAAVAVPQLLASEPTAAPAPPAAAVKSDSASVLATEPIVARADDSDRSGRRQVLGSRKNPFKPQATPTPVPKAKETAPAPTAPTTTEEAAKAPDGSSVGGSPAPVTPITPAPVKKKYELNELTVRFGASESTTRPPRKDVKRLQALPSSEEPVLIYLGVLKDKKTAVFLVDSGIIAQGDGTCMPSRTSCETIHIKEGETEFFDVASEDAGDESTASEGSGAQYQLDVLKIRKKSTTSAKQAKKSLARVSKAGHKILKARIAGDGPIRYQYNGRSGRLEKLSHKAYRSIVAKAARAARAHF